MGRSVSGGWRTGGYFGSRWKGAYAPPENSRMTAIAASRQPVSRTPLEEGRGWARSWLKSYASRHRPILQPRIGSANVDGKACLILLSEMMADP